MQLQVQYGHWIGMVLVLMSITLFEIDMDIQVILNGDCKWEKKREREERTLDINAK